MAQARRWCFMWNNYDEEDQDWCKTFLNKDHCVYAIVGMEKGETRHLQGFMHLKHKTHLTTLKNHFTKKAHFEPARGTDVQNRAYCSKEGNLLLEIGEPAESICQNPSTAYAKEMGKRLADGEDLMDLLEDEDFFGAYSKHRQTVLEYKEGRINRDILSKKRRRLGQVTLRPWQTDLYKELLETEPDPRTIIWYFDPFGDSGKSYFCNYFSMQFPESSLSMSACFSTAGPFLHRLLAPPTALSEVLAWRTVNTD